MQLCCPFALASGVVCAPSLLELMKSAPSSASAAEDMMVLITCDVVRRDPLFGGLAVSLDMKNWPPALLRAFVLER